LDLEAVDLGAHGVEALLAVRAERQLGCFAGSPAAKTA
jgi:hypothetical protein